MSDKAILFKGVSKVFPAGTHALREVNWEVNEGEFMVVVGPSGCGKSTLLRLIAGLESPSNGQIDLFGKNAWDLSPQERDIGMVFQNYALFPHLSVFDNIAYGLKIRRESGPEIRKKVDLVARKLDILQLLMRKPHQLSGGQRQRVALGDFSQEIPKFIYMMNHWAILIRNFAWAYVLNWVDYTGKMNGPRFMLPMIRQKQ